MTRKDPEHWEKYALLIMALGGYILLALFSGMAVFQGIQGAETIVATFGVMVLAALVGMIIRKVSKYKHLKSFEIGPQGVKAEMEENHEG